MRLPWAIRRALAAASPAAYAIDLANTLIMGVALLAQPQANLAQAKQLLADYAAIPRVSELLKLVAQLEQQAD